MRSAFSVHAIADGYRGKSWAFNSESQTQILSFRHTSHAFIGKGVSFSQLPFPCKMYLIISKAQSCCKQEDLHI